MTAKCVGCGLDWNVSIYQKIPRTGYICPHCESRLRAGETLPNIQASQKARPQRTKGATLCKKIALKNAARGTAFDYAGQSWILLENDDGRALCLSKDIIETRAFDEGNCNNFAVASSKEYLNGAYLDNLLEDVNGPNAFLTTELDLTTDDGLKDYGTCTVTIFLLTVDQYRRNRDVIPNADDWWWLSTAFSTKSNGYESLARSVDADGALHWNFAYYGYYGLRPACYLDSDLLISIEDDEATDDVTPEHAGEIIAALAEQFGGTFATEDQLTTALSFMLGTLRATREKEARHE
jgi:hypothetical protein